MAVPKIKPMQGIFATMIALTMISAAPVLAAPDRGLCDDTATPTLDITSTDFSSAADGDEAIELLGRSLEFASRGQPGREDEQSERTESAVEEDANSETGNNATGPADAGPLVHKRPMYRRDI